MVGSSWFVVRRSVLGAVTAALMLLPACEAIIGLEGTEMAVGGASAQAGQTVGGVGAAGGARTSGGSAGSADAGEAPGGAGNADSGAGGVDEPVDAPPTILSDELPHALFNVQYEFQFEAVGSEGSELRWELAPSDDGLPSGIQLEPSGSLRGSPQEEGVFVFDVRAVDDQTQLATTASFHLRVVKRRWLFYTIGDSSTAPQLYALDPNTGEKIWLSGAYAEDGVSTFDFSPDGQFLAFIASAYGHTGLFIVDLRVHPHSPQEVAKEFQVQNFAWSPDSRTIALSVDGEPKSIFHANLEDDWAPQLLTTTRAFPFSLAWVTNDLLIYNGGTIATSVRRTKDGFGPPEPVAFVSSGFVKRTWSELEVAWFHDQSEDCAPNSWLMELNPESPERSLPFTEMLRVSPDFAYVARGGPGAMTRIHRPWDEEPVVAFPAASTCVHGSWSHDSEHFAAVDNGNQIRLFSRTQGTLETLQGDYGTISQFVDPTFSPDDRWLAFSSERGAFAARVDGGVMSEARPMGRHDRFSTGLAPTFRFAPDSTRLTISDIAFDGTSRLLLAEVNGDWQELRLGEIEPGDVVSVADWSVHSTEIAVWHDRPQLGMRELHLTRAPRDSTLVSTQRIAGDVSCVGFYCENVIQAKFQP